MGFYETCVVGRIFLIVSLTSSFFAMEVESIKHHPIALLPHGAVEMTPYYDGSSDYIYMFAGMKALLIESNTDVFRFSISRHTVEIVGKTPPIDFTYRTIVVPGENPSSHLYYLQTAYEDDTYVYRYDMANGTSTTLGKTSIRLGGAVNVVADVNGTKNYAFGGRNLGQNIVELAVEDGMIMTSYVGNLSQSFVSLNTERVGNTAFIFGDTDNDVGPHNYLTLDLETLESSPPLLDELELFDVMPTVVATKRDELFIFGGVFARNQTGIVQMNTTTQESRFIHIEGFPEYIGDNLTYFMAPPTSVYVESQNRIYFFGGITYFLAFLPNIWYIDLNDIPDFVL